MNLTIENILLIGSLLLFVSVIAGKTSYKFGVPTLLPITPKTILKNCNSQ
jgi:cell volume regulation protein A